ncbi:MAG: hypothetical protein ABIQ44_11785, partial [Chloroflexia bacterium]
MKRIQESSAIKADIPPMLIGYNACVNGFYSFPPLIAHLLEMVILALLLLIATGVGLRLLRLLRVYNALRLSERLLFGVALGLGALALLMLAMGLLGIITLISGLIVLIVLAGSSYTTLR